MQKKSLSSMRFSHSNVIRVPLPLHALDGIAPSKATMHTQLKHKQTTGCLDMVGYYDHPDAQYWMIEEDEYEQPTRIFPTTPS